MTTDKLKELVATMTPASYTLNQKEFVLAIAVLAFEAGRIEGRKDTIAIENQVLAGATR